MDKAIKAVLAEYGDDVYKVLDGTVNEITEEGVRKLQAVNNFGAKGKEHITGAYSRDWTTSEQPVGRLKIKRIVHNMEHYRLAHLLEKGHVIKNGTKREFGSTEGKQHIKPVEEWINAELPKRVEGKIKQL